MSSNDRDNDVEPGVEGETRADIRQTSAAQSMERCLPLRRQDCGRPQAAVEAHDRLSAFTHITLIGVIEQGVRRIISFARQVPGFNTLITNDQICLIKRMFDTFMVLTTQFRKLPNYHSLNTAT